MLTHQALRAAPLPPTRTRMAGRTAFQWTHKSASATVLALLMVATMPALSQESQARPSKAGAQSRLDQPFKAPASADLEFEVKGKVSGFSYNASAKLDWQQDGETYQVEQSIRAPIIGTRSQKSQGQIAEHYLQPESFTDSSRNKRNLSFSAADNSVLVPATQVTHPSPEGAQDRLSVFFQLSGLMAANESLRQVGQTIPIWTVASNKQETWQFEVESIEAIDLPIGQLPAIKLKRIPRKDNDQIAEIWLSPDVAYLPVRIHFEDDGDAADLKMTKYRFKDTAQP